MTKNSSGTILVIRTFDTKNDEFLFIRLYSKAKCTSNPREYLLLGKKDLIRNFWQARVLEMGVV